MAGVIATCGKTCSGKSRYAREVQRISGGVILSCDEITLMFPGAEHGRILPLVKQYLLKKSLEITAAGADVILDWGLWQRSERDQLRSFYKAHGVTFRIVYIEIPDERRREFIARRNSAVASGAEQAYIIDEGLEQKLNSLFEPPSADEDVVRLSGCNFRNHGIF